MKLLSNYRGSERKEKVSQCWVGGRRREVSLLAIETPPPLFAKASMEFLFLAFCASPRFSERAFPQRTHRAVVVHHKAVCGCGYGHQRGVEASRESKEGRRDSFFCC